MWQNILGWNTDDQLRWQPHSGKRWWHELKQTKTCVYNYITITIMSAEHLSFGLERWLSEESACYPGIRTWVWMPRTHAKAKHAARASVILVLLPAERRESPEACVHSGKTRVPLAKVESTNWHQKVSPDHQMHTVTCTSTFTQTRTKII